ncbi:metallophosphoesterase [Salinispira pacifica]
MRRESYSADNLERLYHTTPPFPLHSDDRYVIFSDLHMGDGSRLDDFRHNSGLFYAALRDYYLEKGFGLILNGDIEELERFRLDPIRRCWSHVYDLFDRFRSDTVLYRLLGNHDMELGLGDEAPAYLEALRFVYRGNNIFIFHGHQTKKAYRNPNPWVRISLRYLANPLGVRNFSVSHDSLKQFKTEKRVYSFATRSRVMSIIGHTHRPLFESMSKVDSIKFRVEQLCRAYPEADAETRSQIESIVQEYQDELTGMNRRARRVATTSSLYGANLVTPCMFNSGCVIGKRGMTCLEIDHGEVALVHWFDRNNSDKYLRREGHRAARLGDSDFYRIDIKRDSLDYIFSRINLLASRSGGTSAIGRRRASSAARRPV